MNICKAGVYLFAFSLLAGVPLQALDFPGDNFYPGWQRSGACAKYDPSGLYNVIDGGAELFLEMGFLQLQVQKYVRDGSEIALEAYRMENETAAMGIYLLKCSKETPLPGIADRHSGDRFQIVLLKNNYFIQINSFSGREDLLPVMTTLARQIGAAIPVGAPVRELDILPAENQVPGAALLMRGPYSLQVVYTLGDGDVLQLAGKVFAVAGDYRDVHGQIYTLILVPHSDNDSASRAFTYLRKNLDPYLQVVAENSRAFIFKDFQNRYGQVAIQKQRLIIQVKLVERPVLAVPE